MPPGASLCVLHGPTAGRPWAASAAREELRVAAVRAGVRRRFAPHQLRHAHAVEMAREGIPITVIQARCVRSRAPSSWLVWLARAVAGGQMRSCVEGVCTPAVADRS